jgi:hypothetical protein
MSAVDANVREPRRSIIAFWALDISIGRSPRESRPLRQSVFAECLVPASTDTTQEGRIDDQFPKRIDQCHVERREAADVADIDPYRT